MPFELPEGWYWERFGSYLVNRDSERIPMSVATRKKLEKTYDYYGASGVIDKVDDYLFDKPLLLIGEDGANLVARSTPIAFIARGKYWVNNHAHVLDSNTETQLRYVESYINSINLEPYLTGTAQPKLNQDRMNTILLAVPPLAEQRRIVDVLGKYLALVDGIERDRAELDVLLAQLKSKVLDLAVRGELTERDQKDEPASELLARIREDKLAMVARGELKPKDVKNDTVVFTGSDGLRYEKPADGKGEAKCIEGEIPFEIPEGWSWARLGQLIATCGGKTPSKANEAFWEGGGVPWITSKDMKATELFGSQIELTESGAAETNMVPAGSVLMVVRSGILRRLLPVAINRVETTINQDLKAMTPYDLRLSDWLITCFNALDKRIRDIYHKDGTTVDSIEFDAMLTMLLPVPPLAEQRCIVETIKTAFALTNL